MQTSLFRHHSTSPFDAIAITKLNDGSSYHSYNTFLNRIRKFSFDILLINKIIGIGSGVRWTRTKSRLRDGFGRRLGHGYTENLGHVPVFDILRLTLSIRPYSMAHTPEEKVSIVFPGTVNQSTTDTHKVSDMNGSCLSPCPNPDLESLNGDFGHEQNQKFGHSCELFN